MTEAMELYLANGRSAGVWACGQCKQVKSAQEDAESCCRPWKCQTCGADVSKYTLQCSPCRWAALDAKEAEKLAAAELVEDFDGWVWAKGLGCRDGFFESIDELLDFLADEPEHDRPEFVHCCRKVVKSVDVESILERLDEDGWDEESMTEHAADGSVEKLRQAVDEFNAANAEIFIVWEIDTKRKVAVPSPATA